VIASAPTGTQTEQVFNRRLDLFLTVVRLTSRRPGHCDCCIARTGYRGSGHQWNDGRNHGKPRHIAVRQSAGRSHHG
jgi:hypothetical protein